MNIDRQLATIRRISSIEPIPNADAIELARVDGWQVVVKKGEFKEGCYAIYCEIDSWIPHELAPFLSKGKEPREFKGIKGERLRTIKLRGTLSQGLLLPILFLAEWSVGDDVSERLGIIKYEKELPAQLRGQARGAFPSFIPRTDQPRIQNVYAFMSQHYSDSLWEVTEKLDGSSITIYYNNGAKGVCSRNLDLIESEENAFWQATRSLGVLDTLEKMGKNIALQGELIGPGVQGNPYNLSNLTIRFFDVFDIDKQSYLIPSERQLVLSALGINRNNEVPVIGIYPLLTLEELLLAAESEGSKLDPNVTREGLVFKNVSTPNVSFKVISNKWLLKKGE